MQSDCPSAVLAEAPVVTHDGAWADSGLSHGGPLPAFSVPIFWRSVGTAFVCATVFKGKESCADLAHTWWCVNLLKYMLPGGEERFKQFWSFNCVSCHAHRYQFSQFSSRNKNVFNNIGIGILTEKHKSLEINT